MSKNTLKRAKEAFYIDGSLRDVYVLRTNEQDWQTFLTFLRTSSYPVELIIAGKQQPIPDRIEEIFALVHKHGGMLRIDEEHLALHCYFYTYEEIECDLDPRNINNEQQLSRLLDFIHRIGLLLNKPIVLTPENASWAPLFRFDPTTGQEEWFLPSG